MTKTQQLDCLIKELSPDTAVPSNKGDNTPGIIKYPFWKMTAANTNAAYACINLDKAFCPDEMDKQSICIDADIGQVIDSCLHF